MNIRKQFFYDPAIEVSAAQIGISKWNWESVKSGNEEDALWIMKKNRFDVLPVENEDGTFTSYYSTQEWNDYSRLNLIKTKDAPKIYYRTSLNDLVKKFEREDQFYYFLTDSDQVLGLVSYVNLNCQLVYNYLFFILADIERSISSMLKDHLDQREVIEEFKRSKNTHQQELVESFDRSVRDNSDTDIFELMYLQSIGITLKKFTYKLPHSLKGLAKYSSKFSSEGVYGSLRNRIMHPVRPVLSDKDSIKKINELLVDYDHIKGILDSHSETLG